MITSRKTLHIFVPHKTVGLTIGHIPTNKFYQISVGLPFTQISIYLALPG